MTLEEQLSIAFDLGRLAAWNGRIHKPSGLEYCPALTAAWQTGVETQCKAMQAQAAKMPLLFPDEKSGK